MPFDPTEHPHRRYNQLTGDWILVSPHRTARPWRGQVEKPALLGRPKYDPGCYLCPGNQRAGGVQNPKYTSTFVFSNDFAALLPDVPAAHSSHELLRAEAEAGTCRVICFSPRHDLTLPEMALEDIQAVIGVWAEQTAELGKQYRWVQVFENKGEIMGCSNPHPHGQIWAGTALPNEAAKEECRQREHYAKRQAVLLLDYVGLEIERAERVVLANDDWVALVPYWALWPFEVLLLPRRRQILRLTDVDPQERAKLADILKRLLIRFDNLFETSFPYSMGWHGAPTDAGDYPHWQLHAHFYPPLLRSATVRKFMVGYEMLGEPQRDLTAEQAARRLRELPERHYRGTS